jgi:hypothetical protein
MVGSFGARSRKSLSCVCSLAIMLVKASSKLRERASRAIREKLTMDTVPLVFDMPSARISRRRLLTSNTAVSATVRMSYWSPSMV